MFKKNYLLLGTAFVTIVSVACETPSKPSEPTSDSFAEVRESGFMSIAGPGGIAHGEFNFDINFQTRKGKWTLKIVQDADGFLEPESGLELFGEKTETGDYLFTDVENYLKLRDRDAAVALTFQSGKLSEVVYGNWPTFISKAKENLKKIHRYAGSFLLADGADSLPIEYSLIVNWNSEPPKGFYWQTHVETEGKIPESVVIADNWSFTSSDIRIQDGSCKGCKAVTISQQSENEAGKLVTDEKQPKLVIQISENQKIQGIQAGDAQVKLGK